jgi:hypothetical protein
VTAELLRLEGWKEIARFFRKSVSWVKRRSKPEHPDPIPISYPGRTDSCQRGTPTITFAKAIEWKSRHGMAERSKHGLASDGKPAH